MIVLPSWICDFGRPYLVFCMDLSFECLVVFFSCDGRALRVPYVALTLTLSFTFSSVMSWTVATAAMAKAMQNLPTYDPNLEVSSCVVLCYLVGSVGPCLVVSCLCRVVCCVALRCVFLSCVKLSCLVLSCLVLSCIVLCCPVWSDLSSCFVLSCLCLCLTP